MKCLCAKLMSLMNHRSFFSFSLWLSLHESINLNVGIEIFSTNNEFVFKNEFVVFRQFLLVLNCFTLFKCDKYTRLVWIKFLVCLELEFLCFFFTFISLGRHSLENKTMLDIFKHNIDQIKLLISRKQIRLRSISRLHIGRRKVWKRN